MTFCSPRDISERRTEGVLVGGGVFVGAGAGVLVGSGVFVGTGAGVLVGSGVFVGTEVGVLVGSGVLVGTGVEVGAGLAAHPLIARMTRPRSASRKHALSGVFCISITSCISEKRASRMPMGCRITDVENGLVLFHISNLDFFHRSEPRPRGD
jgi:hypothetical protein